MFLITRPIKFIIYFSLSFLILSFPINKKPIFNHINDISAPYTHKLFSMITTRANKGIEASKEITNNMISSSSKNHADKVKTKQSSIRKDQSRSQRMLKELRAEKNEIKKEEHETYTAEEQDTLNRILNGQ